MELGMVKEGNVLVKVEDEDIDFLNNIDVLVDGKFVMKEKDLNCLFRGSRNQRLINVPETLKTGKIVLFDENKYLGNNNLKRNKIYI